MKNFRKICKLCLLVTLGLIFSLESAFAQFGPESDIMESMDDDLSIGGDIFSDFNQDLEASQVLEDERFYRYGRFFSLNMGLGLTTYLGNRGRAYENEPPSYSLSISYFFNFQVAFIMGLAFSKHHMIIDTETIAFQDGDPGLIEISMFRTFWGFKYYLDTTDLGTAITYSNPYLIGRFEYWYQKNKFVENEQYPPQSGGGLGTAFGMGLEFPVEIRSSYIGVELLYHSVKFFDKFTQDYRHDPENPDSEYGYEDLAGGVITLMVSYNLSW